MEIETSRHVKPESSRLTGNGNRTRYRTPPYIKLVADSHCARGDSLDLLGTQLRDHAPPLADGSRADPNRPRDIRGSLKVIQNVLLEHDPMLTAVYQKMQPQFRSPALTLVNMDLLPDPEDRLADAMRVRGVDTPALAKACGVSRVSVGKWLKGGKMSAENYAAAGRALGVHGEWLRIGLLPRERPFAQEERELDTVYAVLEAIAGPLAAFSAAIEKLAAMRAQPKKRKGK